MEYGLKIYNDDLILIIDSTYTNWALWEHGESVNTVDQGGYHDKTITFSTVSSQPPLIAIKPDTDDYLGLGYYTKSGANYSGFNMVSEDKVVTFDWQAFIPRTDASGETYGLKVYDSTQTLVFDSGHVPMVISDVDTASPAYNTVSTITYPSDANAYHIMSPWGRWQTIGEWNGSTSTIRNYLAMFKSLGSTTVSFGGREFSAGSIPVDKNEQWGYWPDTWTIITVKKAF